MIGLSLLSILITSIVIIFFVTNISLNSTEKAISLNKQFSSVSLQINKNASFAIFTNGTLRNFSAPMYHNLSADVFLEQNSPNIIHVKKMGITYDDFFKTLPMSLTSTCLTTGTGQTFCNTEKDSLKFYLNGREDKNLLTRQIQNNDRLLITFGPVDDPDIISQLQQISNP